MLKTKPGLVSWLKMAKTQKYGNLGVFTINRGGNKTFLPFYYLEREEREKPKS